MPTGYTSVITEGATFKQFVWRCARGMGALVAMRDEPLDAPIPERFEPSDYHPKQKADAESRLARLRAMTPGQAKAAAAEAHNVAVREWERRQEERKQQRAAYSAMLKRVRAWQPPGADHKGFKDFMLQQVQESMERDTGHAFTRPKKVGWRRWHADAIAHAESDVEYHATKHAEEVRRTESRNAWLAALRASVPPPAHTKKRTPKR